MRTQGRVTVQLIHTYLPELGCFVGGLHPWVVPFALRERGLCGSWQRKLLVVQWVSWGGRESWMSSRWSRSGEWRGVWEEGSWLILWGTMGSRLAWKGVWSCWLCETAAAGFGSPPSHTSVWQKWWTWCGTWHVCYVCSKEHTIEWYELPVYLSIYTLSNFSTMYIYKEFMCTFVTNTSHTHPPTSSSSSSPLPSETSCWPGLPCSVGVFCVLLLLSTAEGACCVRLWTESPCSPFLRSVLHAADEWGGRGGSGGGALDVEGFTGTLKDGAVVACRPRCNRGKKDTGKLEWGIKKLHLILHASVTATLASAQDCSDALLWLHTLHLSSTYKSCPVHKEPHGLSLSLTHAQANLFLQFLHPPLLLLQLEMSLIPLRHCLG